jgi:hypothetical protein
MASPSERLAELRAALRELEACVAQFQAKQAAARGYDPRRMNGVRAVGSLDDARAAPKGDASLTTITAARLVDAHGRPAKVLRLLRPRIRAVVDWWRRSISQ